MDKAFADKMISEYQLMKKIEEDAAIFRQHIREKRFQQAKYLYDRIRNVVCYMELDENIKDSIFGVRKDRGEIKQDGIFRMGEVNKVYLESCIKSKTSPEECFLCREHLGQKK